MSQKISGIYKITNKINGKVYIGQSNDIKTRWNHEHGGVSTKNILLREEILKFGLENFCYEILIEENDSKRKDLLEKQMIKEYNSTNPDFGYNVSTGGNSNYSHSEKWKLEQSKRLKEFYKNNPNWLTEERREKLRKAGKYERTEEQRKKASEHRKGFKYSEESKAKMSASAKKRISKDCYFIKNHDKIIELSNKAKFKKVRCIETGEVFNSIKEAKEKVAPEAKSNHIGGCCKGYRNVAFGYHWEYAE